MKNSKSSCELFSWSLSMYLLLKSITGLKFGMLYFNAISFLYQLNNKACKTLFRLLKELETRLISLVYPAFRKSFKSNFAIVLGTYFSFTSILSGIVAVNSISAFLLGKFCSFFPLFKIN